jgi:adhesin transport system membrane fusion protein
MSNIVALPRLEKSSRQIRHLAQYAIVEEAGISVLSRLAVLTVAGVVVAFVVWASIMRIEEVSVGFGTVVPSQSVQVVQHLEGGIVREVMVSDRQMVEVGQTLARLDPIQATAELEQSESRLISLEGRAERLRAFVENRAPAFKVPLRHASLITDQLDILRANENRWRSQRSVFEEQILQKREEISAALHQQRAVGEQLRLVSEEVDDARNAIQSRAFEQSRLLQCHAPARRGGK